MVNRIQRSEGLMTERIENVRVTAQQMAHQAQAAAVTSLRGELREVETRMLGVAQGSTGGRCQRALRRRHRNAGCMATWRALPAASRM